MHLTKVNCYLGLCVYTKHSTHQMTTDCSAIKRISVSCIPIGRTNHRKLVSEILHFFFSLVVIYLFIFLILIYFFILKNWFMISVRLSSYGCTREVWRAWGKRKGRFRRYDFAYDYRTRHALIRHDYNTNRVVEIDLQHPYDRRTQREKCRRILKHVLKLYDNRSHIQCYMMRVVYNFCLRKQRALQKIACDKIVPF